MASYIFQFFPFLVKGRLMTQAKYCLSTNDGKDK